MTNCLRGFCAPFCVTICSNSNERATQFSATRLPTSLGEVPAGQFLKWSAARVAGARLVSTSAASESAIAFGCLRIFRLSPQGYEINAVTGSVPPAVAGGSLQLGGDVSHRPA